MFKKPLNDPNAKPDLFGAPIPGQSLTGAKGATPWEKPAQFVEPDKACDYIWQTMTQPRSIIKIVGALKVGVSCEFIARTLIFQGFTSGKWNPDVALLISKPVLYMVVKIGEMKGVKDMKVLNPDKETEDAMKSFADALATKTAEVKGNDSAPAADTTKEPAPIEFKGLMGSAA